MNDVSEKFTIQLRIGNQTYPITIRRDMEEIYRKATQQINDKLNLYKSHFPNQGEEKYMSMVMLDIAVKRIQCEMQNDTEPFMVSLDKLTQEIEEILPQKK
jgi:hypothetical protein